MTELSNLISISERFARSINLDRDVGLVEPLQDYIVTARSLNVIERIANVGSIGKSGGAWSITGPYGSGKSSLALLIDAVFGPRSQSRSVAWKLVEDASPEVAITIRQIHNRAQTQEQGFHRGVITARRESIAHTLLRALHSAVIRSYGKIPSARKFKAAKSLTEAYKLVCANDQSRSLSPTTLIEIARCLALDAPLLLVIDEFGKNLEAINDDNDTDPYLLQQLAELGQGLGLPIFILTLQHQSFKDYFAGSSKFQRKEWAKVQGRFEDIPYIESREQSQALISSVFTVKDDRFKSCINRWANEMYSKINKLGISGFSTPQNIASCYPLHPLTTLALPELCNRFGQHERTMFSFLTGGDMAAVANFINSRELKKNSFPSVGLDSVFDYFVAGGTLVNLVASQTSRWIELSTRLRDVHGLTEHQLILAKSIAILNLISISGSLRASHQILELMGSNVKSNLKKLESIGLVIFRTHADEYRIWRGSDINVNDLLESAFKHVRNKPLSELLQSIDPPLPVVAARHSAENETLRVFRTRFSDGNENIESIPTNSPFDGELVLVVGDKVPKLIEIRENPKPTVFAIPKHLDDLIFSVREIAALSLVLEDQSVKSDFVAFSEIRERFAITQSKLEQAVRDAFSAHSCRWVLLYDAQEFELEPSNNSAPLSEAADRIYRATPIIRNEMLNRAELSTQGAKARRLVIEAMVTNSDRENLGLEGFGPEVAIVKAVIQHGGMHGPDNRNQIMVFRKPTDESFKPTWNAIIEEFNRAKQCRVNVGEIYDKLMSPPFGIKAGSVPLFVIVALLVYRDEVAIYEHGTFKPMLTPELCERMVKNPKHYDVKHFASTTGARRQLVEELARCFDLRPSFRKHRVSNVLTVVGHLVSQIRKLNNYAIRTQNIDSVSIRVRDTLLSAVEPDELLFDALPRAIGHAAVKTDSLAISDVKKYAIDLKSAFDGLVQCYEKMLDNLLQHLLDSYGERNRHAVSGQAATLIGEVLNREVRVFINTLANNSYDDRDWIKAIATVVSEKAPEEWTDDDCIYFQHELERRLDAFRRLIALHITQREIGGEKFTPILVTMTKPNGDEFVELVSIQESVEENTKEVLEDTMHRLTLVMGSEIQARKTLLALISEHMFEDSDKNDDDSKVKIKLGRIQRG